MNNAQSIRINQDQLTEKIRNDSQKYGLCVFNSGKEIVSPPGTYRENQVKEFEYYFISHLIKGSGKLWLPDVPEREIKSGNCIIIPPYQKHKYGATTDSYCEDHVCFIGPVAYKMFSNGLIQTGVVNFGIARRLLPVIDKAECPSVESQFDANLRLQRLLLDLFVENRDASHGHGDMVEKLLGELKKNINHWWTISEMSEYCQVGEDLLRKLFVKHTGMLPKQYLDCLRMRMAETMLMENKHSIKDIAETLGYKDRFHFSRRFKSIVGLSPQNYQKRFKQS